MIIGIAGNINSGKDTVASMLLYIHTVGKNNAKYRDWITKRMAYDNSFKHKIVHFAYVIKSNLADIFCIDVDYFNNRKFKDELWYYPSTGKFIEDKELKSYYNKITLDNFDEFNANNPNHVIKLRTLIQTYAEKCKEMFGELVWCKTTINQAYWVNQAHKICVIPDVRFHNESLSIRANNGIVIKINRLDNTIKSNHVSENNDFEYDYLIENNGNLQNLFYKVLAIYEQIKNK